MKRVTFFGLIAAFALSAGPVLGQGLGIGVQGGATFATLAGDDVSDADYKTGLAIGVRASFGLAPMLSVQPELNYMQKGAEVSDVDITGTFNLTYLQIPVLLKLSVPTPVGPNPYIYAGPAVSFEADCSVEATDGSVTVTVDCDDPDADFLERKTMTWAAVAGAGIGFDLLVGEATLDVRYDLGLTSIDDSADEADVKNRAITVMLGYSIGLGM